MIGGVGGWPRKWIKVDLCESPRLERLFLWDNVLML
jgi:hypothetical protein